MMDHLNENKDEIQEQPVMIHPQSSHTTQSTWCDAISSSIIDSKEYIIARINEASSLLQHKISSGHCFDALTEKYFQELRRIEFEFVAIKLNKSSIHEQEALIHKLESLIDMIKRECDNEVLNLTQYHQTDANNNQINESNAINQAKIESNMFHFTNTSVAESTTKANKRKQMTKILKQSSIIATNQTQLTPSISSIKRDKHDQHLRQAMSLSAKDLVKLHSPQKLPTTTTITNNDLQPSQQQQEKQQPPAETPSTQSGYRRSKALPEKAVEIMKEWYEQNRLNPYPTEEQRKEMAVEGGIKENQVKAWFANKRNRSNNTKPKQKSTKKANKKSSSNDISNPQQTTAATTKPRTIKSHVTQPTFISSYSTMHSHHYSPYPIYNHPTTSNIYQHHPTTFQDYPNNYPYNNTYNHMMTTGNSSKSDSSDSSFHPSPHYNNSFYQPSYPPLPNQQYPQAMYPHIYPTTTAAATLAQQPSSSPQFNPILAPTYHQDTSQQFVNFNSYPHQMYTTNNDNNNNDASSS